MLEFTEKKKITRLTAKDENIEVSIHEENPWDRKNRKQSDTSIFRVSVSFMNDENYNAVELCCETIEEAKALAQDAVNFLKRNRPALSIKEDTIFED